VLARARVRVCVGVSVCMSDCLFFGFFYLFVVVPKLD